ncbi:hypothetical protein ACFL2P_02345 [Candidatus Moduliflexota bacterium]
MKRVIVLSALLAGLFGASLADGAEYGVYVQAVEKADGTFDEVVGKVSAALGEKGWQLVKTYEAAVPGDCGFRAHTIVLHNAVYARKLLTHGPMAAFMLPPRVSVFEEEEGIGVVFTNPLSLSRTMLGEGTADNLATETAAELSSIIAAAAGGKAVDRQIGQMRSRGKVGGMGGGDFKDKVEIIHEADAATNALQDVASAVVKGIKSDKQGWSLAYHIDCVPQGVVILGVNRSATEAKSYEIAGGKRKSKANACPGIDHAPSFPIEIVVFQVGNLVKVAILDEMYRMKIYFEDAGKWAFMKNMTMPGQIENEIVDMALSGLK